MNAKQFHSPVRHWSTTLLTVLVMASLILPCSAAQEKPAPTSTPDPALVKAINDAIQTKVNFGGFSGAVLVAKDGGILSSAGYGLANAEKNTPNTAKTKFRIGTITEQFTAMAILMLQHQGKLNVKDPICKYIPDCPAAWQEITSSSSRRRRTRSSSSSRSRATCSR